jgi:prepilin-type N-terminal cleavage/methylation domain-containing protein
MNTATRKNTGFTIVEMLVAVAILAMLLTSVAVALHGSLVSYRENEKIAETMQVARVVLNRLVSEVRTADAVESDSQRVTIIPPVNPEHVTEMEYELDGGVLYYRRVVMGTEESQAFISSDENVQVEAFNVTRETDVDGEGVTYTASLTVQLILRSGANCFPLTASACPRRNQEY